MTLIQTPLLIESAFQISHLVAPIYNVQYNTKLSLQVLLHLFVTFE
jgi:hypothetical protein